MMSDSANSLYGPLRRSLELLNEEFRFIAQKHPPIRYQYFTVPADFDLEDQRRRLSNAKTREEKMAIIDGGPLQSPDPNPQEWQAFVTANRKTFGEGWCIWDGPNDGRFWGRFYGDPGGWDDFRSLAESAFLAVCEFNAHLDRCDGHNGWMEILNELGQNTPTPLLRPKGCAVRQPVTELPADGVLYAVEWAVDPEGNRYPTTPVCFELAHDVFVSSMAAIRYMIEPGSVLLIGEDIGYSPITCPLVGDAAPEEQATADEDAGSVSEPSDTTLHGLRVTPLQRFEFDGATWHIDFNRDGKSEAGVFTTTDLGFRYLERLIKQPGKLLKATEVEGDISGAIVRHAEGEEGSGDSEPGQSLGYCTAETVDTKADPRTIREWNKELARIDEELKTSVNPELRADLERERRFIQSELRSCIGLGSRLRPFGAGTRDEKARKRVGNALARAKKLIAKSMPKCGQYLIECVPGENGGFIYRPWLQQQSASITNL